MGKPTGFMEYERKNSLAEKPEKRISHFGEFHIPLPLKERKQQGARCMDCGVPFCQFGGTLGGMTSGCPLNNLIPEWNDLVYTGNEEQALLRLLKTNNFPEFTGRVCPAPCEAACTLGLNNEPVAIKENELGIIENGYERHLIKANPPKMRTGKTIGIVGSGPAGLAAADQLNKRGHLVTVFEREDRIGGLLMYGIPNMKLEKQVIDRRTAIMKEEGVRFQTNVDVGRDYKASSLLKEFDAVILACGASSPRDISVPGRNAKGIYFAVDFLKAATKKLLDSSFPDRDFINARNKNVLVVGGGDTGNDCVGTAIRHGATSVVQLEMLPKLPETRREENPWPEWPRVCKTDYGQKEAIAVFGRDPRVYQTTVKEFRADENGNVKKAICVKLRKAYDKKTSRYVMEEAPGSEYEIQTDLVLLAAGFLGAQSYTPEAFGVKLGACANVETKKGSFYTGVGNIFTAGDMHRGQSLVVWAIAEGRKAAREVDQYLMGYSNLK